MIENEISTLLLAILLTAGGIFGALNLWHHKDYKRLKIENELLKFKLKECEQSRSKRVHEKC